VSNQLLEEVLAPIGPLVGIESSGNHKRKNCVKTQSGMVNFIHVEEIIMKKVVSMFELTLVGIFHKRILWERYPREWIISNCEPFLGYNQVFYTLSRGWMDFIFHSMIGVERVLVLC
jgi:hypothetical protein